MIGYATVGVADMEKAKAFYCALFESEGAKLGTDLGRIAFIGTARDKPMIAVCTPYNGEAPEPGNGNMVAFPARDKETVDKLYNKAMELGASDEGAPGQRIPDRFYGAYVRDPDGNKLCFFVFG
ncbi:MULTISPECIES: VOC family protein [unclassified Sulfitobacter]|jgi:catechol 2,3-dioxygenase-like lactoylglutathione lyase family enzyme|uniref:VOC family protein n=1 Tax=unclassified Sulfitobacter TaxID=196795 RepID=UPI0007C3C365|nr:MULTISPECIES: VOC family protein [unclassified Sulfitobacter]MAM25771.1 VOC family protein [Paracoccaceae bacterium]KZY02691.1 glyoxalase [Sulfitobacter sp. HI0023]KZY26722.1 glyoxalase [Sulfitobacter sp. HI0040]KZZ66942.1 glyoxalase [Sulfitobacter sp. HI0129]MBO29002.1 VOC family protein [Paracoccaceae bacterium]